MLIATIDTGTTNTRIIVWDEKKPLAVKKKEVGVRVTSIEGAKTKLLSGIRQCLLEALYASGYKEEDLDGILASGMIGSELGVCEIERMVAPVSLRNLAANCVAKNIPEISKLKTIYFIPGVQNGKSIHDLAKCELVDVMRGEEVEAFGIIDRMNLQGPVVLILPGSHTKIVYINKENEIVGCVTTMAGEMLMELTRSSIISGSLEYSYAETMEEEWLMAGAEEAEKTGLNRTAFLVRIIDLFTEATVNQKANYLLGALLACDIKAIRESQVGNMVLAEKFVILGTNAFSQGMAFLLQRQNPSKKVMLVPEEKQSNLAGYGALVVWQERNRGK